MDDRRQDRVIFVLGAAVIVFLVAGVVLAGLAARHALVADHHYYAFRLVCNAVTCHVERHGGDWPASWDDLSAASTSNDLEWTREFVVVDFSADPASIARENCNSFAAIRVVEPCMEIDEDLEQLIGKLREYHDINKRAR